MKALLIVFITGLLALFLGLRTEKRPVVQALVLAGLTAALGGTCYDWLVGTSHFQLAGMIQFDHFALSFSGVAILATLLIALMSDRSYQGSDENYGDYFALILFSLCGAFCLFSFDNLIMLFLGIEILSIPLYALAGAQKDKAASNEAAIKYFLMGAFATGILLFGIALVYGATASFSVPEIAAAIQSKGEQLPMFMYIGLIMIVVGLSFKIGAAPFHFWGPDVYEGSPNLVTAFMSTVVKMAAFGAFFRLFAGSFAGLSEHWAPTLAVIALLTMTLGNITAILQSGFKRMMAYSSIAHAGYLLLGVLSSPGGGGGAMLVYLLSYAVATISAFAVYMALHNGTGATGLSIFRGLSRRDGWSAAVMAVALLSLAGIPPTAGFFGKYFLFAQAFPDYPLLVLAAVVNSAISVYYYFKIIIEMYFTAPSVEAEATDVAFGRNYRVVLAAGLIILLGLSLAPGWLL